MNVPEQHIELNREISALQSKIQDTQYFIATASCRETQLIYKEVLKEQELMLEKLMVQKGGIINKK